MKPALGEAVPYKQSHGGYTFADCTSHKSVLRGSGALERPSARQIKDSPTHGTSAGLLMSTAKEPKIPLPPMTPIILCFGN